MAKNKLKVAICFRGMLRTAIENKKTFEHYFESKYDVDYFYHSWNIENGAIPCQDDFTPYKETKILSLVANRENWEVLYTKKKKFKQVYKPKLGKFENLDGTGFLRSIWEKEKNMWDLKFHPQFVSCFEVDKLRRRYEEMHNFKYDLVINTRPDIVLKPSSNLNQVYNKLESFITNTDTIGIVNIPENPEENFERIDDVFFVGSSNTMNILLDHFDPKKNNTSFQFAVKHLLSHNIKPINVNFIYCILRDYCSYLDPIEDFNDIFIDDHRLTYGTLSEEHALTTSRSLYKELIKRIDYELL